MLPGHQIWGLTPGFAATFWTGFSFQKIFRERLFSGMADYRRDAYQHVTKSHQTSITPLAVPALGGVGAPLPQPAFPLLFPPAETIFSGLTRNHSDLSVFWDVVWASVCPNPSAAGGFLFGSLNCLDMWLSRSGLPDPAAWNKHLGIGQELRCRGRHLYKNVDHVAC